MNPAEAGRASDRVKELHQSLTERLPGLVDSATSCLGSSAVALMIPQSVIDWIVDVVNKFVEVCGSILQAVWEAIQGAAFPVVALVKLFDWVEAKRQANAISELTDPQTNASMKVGVYWKGPAASAYSSAVKTQSGKAKSVGDACGAVSLSLGIVGAAGVAFYIALAVILVKLIAAIVTAVTAFATAVFSWAGVLLIIEEAAITPAMLVAALSLLAACLGAQAQQAGAIKSALASAFPTGQWPDPTTGRFSDASTGKDGDSSDWRLRP